MKSDPSYPQYSLEGKGLKHEEVESTYGYPPGYWQKDVAEQIDLLQGYFPDIGYVNNEFAEGDLPKGAEHRFAIPEWQSVGSTYSEAVKRALGAINIAFNGKFHNFIEGSIGTDSFRQSAASVSFFRKLQRAQRTNTLIVPAQFGKKHRGRSVLRARELFERNEFDLGLFAVCMMILTHPERFMSGATLWVYCGGDEFDKAISRDAFACSPVFYVGFEIVELDAYFYYSAREQFGSATGFFPTE